MLHSIRTHDAAMDRQRVIELFEQAVELEPGERVAWLACACAGDHEVRVEVERMLRIDAKAATFLESQPRLVANRFDTEATNAPAQFGPWRVLSSIGIGGMGEVWLAERSDGEFEQRVAIKQLAYPTPGLLQRFRQERQILARLEHPNIARLIDGGVDAQGAPYLVMEYVEGVPITDHVRDRCLDLRARLRLFLRVCEAVQYAHQNLVVHRDLKPANIFVTATGEPKLLDFGIAKVLATTDAAAATQTAARLLTPDYAAPEQFSGEPVTTATDVYALGVVLYELLAGQRPLRPVAIGAVAAHTALTADPPAPSAAIERTADDARGRRRALHGDLDRIALTALAAEPTRRYASAEALANDIRRFLGGHPVAARRSSAWYLLRKFAGRNRYALGAAVAIVVVSLGAALVSVHQSRIARAQAARAQAVREFLVGVFEQADPDENKGEPITAHQLLEKGERQLAHVSEPEVRADLTALLSGLYWDIGEPTRVQQLLPQLRSAALDRSLPPAVRAHSLTQLAKLEIYSQQYDAASSDAREAEVLARGAGADGADEASSARHVLAEALTSAPGSAELGAEALVRELLASDRNAYGNRSEPVANDLRLLGIVLGSSSRHTDAVAALREQIGIARALHGERNASVVNGLNELGTVLMTMGDLGAAESAYREALELEIKRIGPDRPQTWDIHSNLIRVYEQQGAFEQALHERQTMLATQRNVLAGTRTDEIALALHSLGRDYRELGRLDEAEATIRESLALWAEVSAADGAATTIAPLENLGVTLTLRGRYAGAEEALRHAMAAMLRHAPDSPYLARIRGELGDVLRRERRFAESVHELDAAVDAHESALRATGTPPDPILATLEAQLAEARLDAGNADGAQSSARQSLALARSVLPKGNYQLGAALFALARTDLAAGNAAAAEPLLREALAVRSPPYPRDDPRVLEVEVALVDALTATGKHDEARHIADAVGPLLAASDSVYATDLRARVAAHLR